MKINKQRILVVGDMIIDRNWLGTCTKLSAEAPVLVVKIDKTFDEPGGALNVVANLQELGAEIDTLGSDGPVKNRLWLGQQQMIRWDETDTCAPIANLGEWPHKWDKVIIADYAKGTITDELLMQIYDLQIPVFVDTKRNPAKYVGWVTAIFPNKSEYEQYSSQYDLFDRCILKLGSGGVAELQFSQIKQSLPAFSNKVVSVNGAGDVLIAAFALKWPARDALSFANLAAAAAVEKPYTGVVTLKDIQDVKKRFRKGN